MAVSVDGFSKGEFHHVVPEGERCFCKSSRFSVFAPHDEDEIDLTDDKPPGCYIQKKGGEHLNFGYSFLWSWKWRRLLCYLSLGFDNREWPEDQTPFEDKSLYPLLCTRASEGAIGPKTAQRLAKGFAEERDAISAKLDELLADPIAKLFVEDAAELKRDFWDCYGKWQKAAELAADDGCIVWSD